MTLSFNTDSQRFTKVYPSDKSLLSTLIEITTSRERANVRRAFHVRTKSEAPQPL